MNGMVAVYGLILGCFVAESRSPGEFVLSVTGGMPHR